MLLPRSAGLIPFALHALAQQLAVAADRFGAFAGAALGRLLVIATGFHFPEKSFALHLLFERAKRLVDVVVADENLHENVAPFAKPSLRAKSRAGPLEPAQGAAKYHQIRRL